MTFPFGLWLLLPADEEKDTLCKKTCWEEWERVVTAYRDPSNINVVVWGEHPDNVMLRTPSHNLAYKGILRTSDAYALRLRDENCLLVRLVDAGQSVPRVTRALTGLAQVLRLAQPERLHLTSMNLEGGAPTLSGYRFDEPKTPKIGKVVFARQATITEALEAICAEDETLDKPVEKA